MTGDTAGVLGPGRPHAPSPPRHLTRKEPRLNGHAVRALAALRAEAAQRRVVVVQPTPCPPHVALGSLRRARWACSRCGPRPVLHLQPAPGEGLPSVVCPACVPLAAVERASPCPECPGTLCLLRNRFGGVYYRCNRSPRCGCTQGSRPDGTPEGPVAVAEIRDLRALVRKALDALARDLCIPRVEAYRSLAGVVRPADPDGFRVGALDAEECRAALAAVEELASVGLLTLDTLTVTL